MRELRVQLHRALRHLRRRRIGRRAHRLRRRGLHHNLGHDGVLDAVPRLRNDGEFRVFDPKTTNVRTESVSTTSGSPDTHTIIFAEGTVFVDYDEAADSTFDSFDENPSDKKVTFKRSNGLKTALLNLPNDVIEDVSVSIDDASNKGAAPRASRTSSPSPRIRVTCP